MNLWPFAFVFVFLIHWDRQRTAIGDNLAATEASFVTKIIRIVHTLLYNKISTFSVHKQISSTKNKKGESTSTYASRNK